MRKQLAAGTVIFLLLGGAALAQTVRMPAPEPASPMLLIKHDGDHGHGRKLGHFKHQADDDENEDGHRGRGRSANQPYRYSPPAPGYYDPSPYYPPPGYGSSYPPPAYYDYYGRPY